MQPVDSDSLPLLHYLLGGHVDHVELALFPGAHISLVVYETETMRTEHKVMLRKKAKLPGNQAHVVIESSDACFISVGSSVSNWYSQIEHESSFPNEKIIFKMLQL